jgi:hypothetical protein
MSGQDCANGILLGRDHVLRLKTCTGGIPSECWM